MVALPAHIVLPTLHITIHSTIVQIYTDVFGVCKTSINKTRTYKGNLFGGMANTEM